MSYNTIFRNINILLLVVIQSFFFTSCNSQNTKNQQMQNSYRELTDRDPVVAGQFYPGRSDELNADLIKLFSEAEKKKVKGEVLAIIAPHAGYVFSGGVAASSFNQINPRKKYETVFVIGSSHRIAFEGASIYNKGNYKTPLGTVNVDLQIANQLINKHDVFKYRPDAHEYEHSLEVQLPFLQHIMETEFKIVPIVTGTQSPGTCKKIAAALAPYFNDDNLFVISTDFSHYPKYEEAVKVDNLTASAIISNDPDKLLTTLKKNSQMHISSLATSLCGWTSVLTLMYITNDIPDIKYYPIIYKNSGDARFYGDKSRVVGYYSIAVAKEKQEQTLPENEAKKDNPKKKDFELTGSDKKTLLGIARNTIEQYVNNRNIPKIDTEGFSRSLLTQTGAFVTIHKEGKLRGCIGRFEPDIQLYKVVQEVAVSSATRDFRFNPVTPEELDDIDIEISVLTPLRKINSADEIRLGTHGIYIKKGHNSGTFLPQVATQTGWNLEEFLGHCSRDKAGIGWDGWKDAELYVYEALIFSENELIH
jgi:AmmeMemoRadiSam system protein B/AmmeMemoRadiSam system protein A